MTFSIFFNTLLKPQILPIIISIAILVNVTVRDMRYFTKSKFSWSLVH